jgi:Domain of unknown function (DUF4145)
MPWKTSETITFSHEKRLQSSCVRCKSITNHKILVSADVRKDAEKGDGYHEHIDTFREWEEYQVIQCLGCNQKSFRQEYYDENMVLNNSDHDVCLYPNSEGRFPIKDIDLVPRDNIKNIYNETLKAISSNQPILSAIGVRTILEAVMQEQKAEGIKLEYYIEDLVRQGKLTRKEADTLHKLQDMGNKATHGTAIYTNTELNVAMDVIEHLLQKMYILSHHTDKHLPSPPKDKPILRK